MFTILFAIEVRRVQLKSVNILKISAKHLISCHLMLSVLFNKDRIRLFVAIDTQEMMGTQGRSQRDRSIS